MSEQWIPSYVQRHAALGLRPFRKVVTRDGVLLGRVFRVHINDDSFIVAQPNIRGRGYRHGVQQFFERSEILVSAVGAHQYITLKKTAKKYGVDHDPLIGTNGRLCHYPVRKDG